MTTGSVLRLFAITSLVVGLVLAGGGGSASAGGPRLLTDEEMEEVTAGGVQLDLRIDPNEQTLDFGFNFGNMFGNGSVGIGATNPVSPSTLAFTGPANLSNSVFLVENMIFNLNLCMQCQANSIIQKGIGVPITFKGVTP